jgi:hypothetical protein
LGQRSRKRRRAGEGPARAATPARTTSAAGPARTPTARAPSAAVPSRSEARDAAARAQLEPLAEGERPGAVVAATLVAAALGVGNLVAFAAGAKVEGKTPNAPGTLAFCALMIITAVGMWRMRYWAVLGFQALLALIVLIFALLLLRASNLLGAGASLVVVGLGGWLFWKLVRAMARIQMPVRRPPAR